jgi:hypothetical protein
MWNLFGRKETLPTVTFVTTVWEKDWRHILLQEDYLPIRQIQNHCFPFQEKLLIINNVNDLGEVKKAACRWVEAGILSRFVVAEELAEEALQFFRLKRSDFSGDWQYYNALGPLAAIYSCQSEYLLYLTGDVRLDQAVDWVAPSLKFMGKHPTCFVANPVWNGQNGEAKRESYRKKGSFYLAKQGFSDQLFLVKKEVFRNPIYGEIRSDADHYPRGDVFEKRVFSYMKNRGWERITYRHGSYTHENIIL